MKQASLDLDIQNTNTRQMGDGSKERKYLKDSTECFVGNANSSGHGVPVNKTKIPISKLGAEILDLVYMDGKGGMGLL